MSFLCSVWFEEQPPEVTLMFPGAITIEGVVVDVEGNPVAGAEVRCRRERHDRQGTWGEEQHEPAQVQTDAEGRFAIAVPECARYQLLAKKAEHAHSRWMAAEPTAARPHAQVRLHLLAMATIRGRIERGDGSAFEGVVVGAEPEAERADPASRMVTERFSPVANVATGADGGFELAVHPDTTWTVVARPGGDRFMDLRRAGVRPGDEGVVIRLADAEVSGCTVHIAIVRADGKPADLQLLRVYEYEDGKERTWLDAGTLNSPTTRIALPRDRQYAVMVRPLRREPVAPAFVGPFWTDRAELHVEVRLEAWGEVPVRVLDASGAPARRMQVSTRSELTEPDQGVEDVDADGRAVLKERAPGAHTLRVLPRRGTVFEQAIVVRPGLNPEVVVRLPAGK